MERFKLNVSSNLCIPIVLDIPEFIFRPSFYTYRICEAIHLEEKEKKGNVIDIGTGSGVIGIVLNKLGCENIYVSDYLNEALDVTKINAEKNQAFIKGYFLSNMFTGIPKTIKFDLVITNPPAFPHRKGLSLNRGMDIAIFSGNDGRQYIERFIENVGDRLNKDGRFVIAIPSFLDWNVVVDKMIENNFSVRSLIEEECPLPTYGYPEMEFIENFNNTFSRSYYKKTDFSVKHKSPEESVPFWYNSEGKIKFHIKVFEGRKYHGNGKEE